MLAEVLAPSGKHQGHDGSRDIVRHKPEHPTFDELIERLSDEHEREITLLRTEVAELRTQLGAMDPVQKFMGAKNSALEEVVERWGQEKHGTGTNVAAVVQQWAQRNRLTVQAADLQAKEAEDTGQVLSEKHLTAEQPLEVPDDDWPPPVPLHKTDGDVFWASAADKGEDSAPARPTEQSGRLETLDQEPSEGTRPSRKAASVQFALPPSARLREIVPVVHNSIMESQLAFREQEMRIKHYFEDASKMSHMAGVMESCFRVWLLLTRHMRARFRFQVLDPWRGDGPTSTAAGGLPLTHNRHQLEEAEHEHHEAVETEAEVPRRSGFGRILLTPNATARSYWDVSGTLLLVWDLILIPMEAFEPDPHKFMVFMDYLTLVFWTLDIFMSCITGYVARGVTVMDPKLIIRNYLKTLFLMDLIVIGPDWIFLFITWASEDSSASSGDPAGGSNRLIRIMRVVRLARLLRLVKLARGLNMLRDRIESEVMFIVANILKLIVMLLIVNHFLGSFWYFVGNLCKNEGESNWIQAHHFEHAGFGYRYFTSLHWSLTQFTPASMDVQPHNIYERIVAIFCLVFGLVLFSSFISSITASMTQLRNMSEDKSKQFWLLRRYLRQRGIDKKLTFRILRYVEYAIKEKTVLVSESKVWSLSLLSQQLREELQYEVSFKCLMSHPFFERARAVSSMSTFQLAEQALTVEMLASRDTLFNPGTAATHMFIVAYGQLKYLKMDELYLDEIYDCQSSLAKDDWACEQALWTKWIHLGCLTAVSEVRLVAIDVKKFEDVINKDPVAWDLAHNYCEKYVTWLNETPRGDLTDVAHQLHMSSQVRNFIDCRAKKRTRNSFTKKALTLVDDEDGQTARTPEGIVPRSL